MSTAIQQNILLENEKYAAKFDKGDLPLPPAKHYLILTCMDARIDPGAAFGISLGDAHIIRNGGGSAKDALRSILISQHLLETREIILIKHTDCGMTHFTNPVALATMAKNVGTGVLSSTFDLQPFSDVEQALKDDVEYLKSHSALLSKEISGWIYDVKTGKIQKRM